MKKTSIHLSILAALLAACLTPMAVKAQLNLGPQFVLPVEGLGEHIRARLQFVDKLGFLVIQGHFCIANMLDKK